MQTEEARLQAVKSQAGMLEAGFTRTAVAVQEASVKEAAAKLDLAKARLSECVIAAPFAGTITRVFVHQGDMAATKAPLLEMADLSSLVVRGALAEANAAEARPGMKAQVRLDALPGQTLSAEVSRVFPQLDTRMRTRTIELAVKDDADLAPGMFGRVRLLLESVPDAVTVPVQAVLVTPAGASVAFAVVDGKAAQRKVRTGIEEGGRIQIVSGLEPGEQVIVSGQEKLKDGAEIRLPAPPGEGQPSGQPGKKPMGGQPGKAGEVAR